MKKRAEESHSHSHGHGQGQRPKRTSTATSSSSAASRSRSSDVRRSSWERQVALLHKNLYGTDISDGETHTALQILDQKDDTTSLLKHSFSETVICKKINIHLIRQQREKDAKAFHDLHQLLTKSETISRRESIVEFLYLLQDKTQTQVQVKLAQQQQQQLHHYKLPNIPTAEEDTFVMATSVPTIRAQKSEKSHRQSQPELQTYSNGSAHSTASEKENQGSPTRAVVTGVKAAVATYGDKLLTLQNRSSGLPNSPRLSTSNGSASTTTRISDTGSEIGASRLTLSMKSLCPNPNVTLRHRGDTMSNQAVVEKDLIKDLVYIFQGIDGNILKSRPAEDKYEIQLTGGNYLHPSLRTQALRLCELGYSYKKIRAWCDKPITQLMTQGFKHALERELQEYYRLLAIVQSMIQQTTTSSISGAEADTPLSEDGLAARPSVSGSRSGEDLTILKLTVWVFDCRVRMEVLASMIEACEDKKGGEICSVLFKYTLHGDPMISSMSVAILSVVAKPLYLMLCQWILYGELEDPHNEFFIAADKECKLEHLWHSMYRIREKMLPSFISKPLAEKILATGKNINFLKHICQNRRGYDCRNEVKIMLEESPVECIFLEDDRILSSGIEMAYRTTSAMVLKVLIDEARLLDHLKAIKNYLLLGQGDFIQYLLELLQDELSKPASKIFPHNLSSILDSAVRATNAQFEEDDILARLDTRILLGNENDLGWDVFCLDYKAHGPIGTVLTEDVIDSYNKLFNTLWRTKRIEAMLSTLWKNQTSLFKFQKIIPELGTVLHRSQLLISELIHFVHQTQYYIMFEATECAWDFLMEKVKKSQDLDQVIAAHADFIATITQRSLLDSGKKDLLIQLRGIFGYVHELKNFLSKFDERVMLELKRRKNRNVLLTEIEANKEFFTLYVSQAKAQIEALYVRTQDMVRSFLLLLNRLQDPDSLTLQCLSFRIDFNEYYATKDSRLSFPLTYQHRRLSNNTFSPCASQSTSGIGLGLNFGLGLSTSMSITEGVEIEG